MKYGLFKVSLCTAAMACCLSIGAEAKDPNGVSLTFLETSDVHGHLTQYDYELGQEFPGGMVRAATIVKKERAQDPELLLIDCGDISQGNMIGNMRHMKPHPALLTLNSMKYDIWEIGNHEFNYEFDVLNTNIKNFKGTVIGGNMYNTDGKHFLAPYVIKNMKGVKVAIIGLDSPFVPTYESDASHYNHMTFTPLATELEKSLKEVKAQKPDVTVVLCHFGEEGEKDSQGMYEIGKQFAGQVDAFLIGHAHSTLLKYLNDGKWEDKATDKTQTCLMETGCNAKNVGKLTLDLSKDANGKWKIDSRTVQLLSCKDVEPDKELSALLTEFHDKSMAASNEVIGQVSKDFHDDPMWLPRIPKEVIQEGPVLDLIHQVLLKNSGADISMTSLFKADSNIKAGSMRVKDACAIYPYDNTMYKLKVNGAQLKAIMEHHCGRFFNQFQPGDVTISFNGKMRMYEYDTFFGVGYKVDISKPVGQRIVDLTFKGKPVTDDQTFTLATNNYRYGQLIQEKLITADAAIESSDNWGDNSLLRSMIINYVRDQKNIAPTSYSNWEIIGYKFDDPQRDLIYKMIKEGKIEVPISVDGRTPNNAPLNGPELRAKGILPALTGK